jgi:integrase
MINVTLRKKASAKGDRKYYYLDFYPAIEIDGRQTRREMLGLFVYDHPRTLFDREHNLKSNEEATMKWLRRKNELNKPEIYNDYELEQLRIKEIGQGSFTDYMAKYVIKHQRGTHSPIISTSKHFYNYAGRDVKFADITEKFCNGFRDYLQTAKNISKNKNESQISKSTASLYFSVFKTVLKGAYKAGHFTTYLNDKLGSLPKDQSRRNYLTLDELNTLAATSCAVPILKRASLFSALTGLRFSDIEKLTWSEVEATNDSHVLMFIQKKTGGIETLPISKQAVDLLGDRSQSKPFEGLVYDAHKSMIIKNWIKSAGITKKITFHCFRHTFATLQLSAGTDIFTVSKLLGHRDLKTTQIYAHVMDEKKREAVNRISINFNTVKP